MSMCRRAFPKKIRRRKTHIPAMDSNASSEADADGPDDVVAYDVTYDASASEYTVYPHIEKRRQEWLQLNSVLNRILVIGYISALLISFFAFFGPSFSESNKESRLGENIWM